MNRYLDPFADERSKHSLTSNEMSKSSYSRDKHATEQEQPVRLVERQPRQRSEPDAEREREESAFDQGLIPSCRAKRGCLYIACARACKALISLAHPEML